MASTKQVRAAKRNIKSAQKAARKKRTIANLPTSVRQDLGRQAAAARIAAAPQAVPSRTGRESSSTSRRRRRASPVGPGWESGI